MYVRTTQYSPQQTLETVSQSITRELRRDYLSEETANIVNSSPVQEKTSRSKSIEFSKSDITPVIVHIQTESF